MPKAALEIDRIDHLVLTTRDLAACLAFYVDTLGLRHEANGGRHALYFGNQKINIHTTPGEFQPAAQNPVPGSVDLCLIVRNDLEIIAEELAHSPFPPITGILPRTGALGPMKSLYLRDPDGNLIELASYSE